MLHSFQSSGSDCCLTSSDLRAGPYSTCLIKYQQSRCSWSNSENYIIIEQFCPGDTISFQPHFHRFLQAPSNLEPFQSLGSHKLLQTTCSRTSPIFFLSLSLISSSLNYIFLRKSPRFHIIRIFWMFPPKTVLFESLFSGPCYV